MHWRAFGKGTGVTKQQKLMPLLARSRCAYGDDAHETGVSPPSIHMDCVPSVVCAIGCESME